MEEDEKVCPRCAETVKAAALVCKHCGYEFGAPVTSEKSLPQGSIPPSVRKPAPSKGPPLAVGCGLVIVLLLIIGYLVSPNEQSADTGDSGTGDASTGQVTVHVSAVDLARAYDANEVAAQNEYGGRTLEVTGVVTGITLDLFSDPVIQMSGVNQFLPVQASFDKSYSDRLSSLSKGQIVTVRCTTITEVISAPMLSDCTLP